MLVRIRRGSLSAVLVSLTDFHQAADRGDARFFCAADPSFLWRIDVYFVLCPGNYTPRNINGDLWLLTGSDGAVLHDFQ
jgi:hypothetical protein